MNLELVTDNALIDELANRFDALVLVGLRDRDETDTIEKFRWKGDYRRCQGLVFSMIARIEESRKNTTEPIEGD